MVCGWNEAEVGYCNSVCGRASLSCIWRHATDSMYWSNNCRLLIKFQYLLSRQQLAAISRHDFLRRCVLVGYMLSFHELFFIADLGMRVGEQAFMGEQGLLKSLSFPHLHPVVTRLHVINATVKISDFRSISIESRILNSNVIPCIHGTIVAATGCRNRSPRQKISPNYSLS
jgi:hypothetical protein